VAERGCTPPTNPTVGDDAKKRRMLFVFPAEKRRRRVGEERGALGLVVCSHPQVGGILDRQIERDRERWSMSSVHLLTLLKLDQICPSGFLAVA